MSSPRSTSLGALDQTTRMHPVLSRLRPLKAAGARKAMPHGRPVVFNEEASTLVEMALTCALLMMVLVGLFQMTFALYSYHYISEAAREATRWAIVRGSHCVGLTGCGADNSAIQTYVQNLGYPGITAANLTTTTTWYTATMNTAVTPNTVVLTSCGTSPGGGCNDPGNQVKVNVVYLLSLNIPLVPAATVHITSTSAMIISQ
jgi:Flp pilus assembly protein TadG